MIRPIVKDVLFLRQKSDPACREDLPVGIDLMDTLQANRERCHKLENYEEYLAGLRRKADRQD